MQSERRWLTTINSRPVSLKEKQIDSSKNVRYLHADGEREGGQRGATDPIWSLNVFYIEKSLVDKGEPVLYSLKDRSKCGFIREELQIVPPEVTPYRSRE